MYVGLVWSELLQNNVEDTHTYTKRGPMWHVDGETGAKRDVNVLLDLPAHEVARFALVLPREGHRVVRAGGR